MEILKQRNPAQIIRKLKQDNIAVRAENIFLKKRIALLEAELAKCRAKYKSIIDIILERESDK